MAHQIKWLRPNRVLYVSYQGFQNEETLMACLDEMASYLDKATQPLVLLINWLEVEGMEEKALINVRGHRTFSHPMAARGVLVGMPRLVQMQNEVSSVSTRRSKNTQYYDTMDEAMHYLEDMLKD